MTFEPASGDDLRMDMAALARALRARALRIVIVTVLLVVATFLVLMFVPKQYESVSSLLVEDRTTSFTEAATSIPNSNGGGNNGSIDALLSSQIELIRSRDTLLAVANQLNLGAVAEFNGSGSSPFSFVLNLAGRKPGAQSTDEAVLNSLNDRLTVVRELDSAVISIHVRSADPDLAAKIANAIATVHVQRRAEQSVADTRDATAWLQQQIDALRKKVEDADTRVAEYRSQNGIFGGANGTTLPDQQISDVGKQITDAQAARGSAQQHADIIRALLRGGQSVEGNDDVRASPVVQGLMQSRATLQASLAERSATLLPGHPTIRGLKAQVSQIDAQIRAEARRIADGLAAQIAVQDGLIGALGDDMKQARLAASTQTRDSVTLDSLTREAKAQRDLLDAYLIKYRDAQGRTDTGAVLPDVRIVTAAAASVVPASPKTGLILGAVAFVALALQVGTVLFGELMSGRAVFDRSARLQAVDPEPRLEPAAPEFAADPAIPAEPVLAEAADDSADEPELDLAFVPPPVVVALSEPEAPQPAPIPQAAFSSLSADLVEGRAHVLLVAGITDARDAAAVADELVGDAVRAGLSVCRVDAGSGHRSAMLGLTDLCAGDASFGDVVHKAGEGLSEVPWGRLPAIDRRSLHAVTLIDALADIYDTVVVTAGRLGIGSNLSVFEGATGRLLLVRDPATPEAVVLALAADAALLGFDITQSLALPEVQSAVA